ncbi:MAG: hypothetical protein IKC63_01470, partial [Clostridia bacterium]|nr:hypothetical protein [Clostridia bacterium]
VYYRKHKAILFEAERENTVLDADLRHLCRFGEVLYQCRFSDCLGKTLSVDRRGRLSFCPYAPEKSMIGDLRGSGDFRQAEAFCRIQKVFEEKRQRCQASCDHYEICMGVCPLEKGCLDFPKRLQDADRYLEELVQNGKSLAVCDYATLHTVISDICFGEAD